MSRVRRVDRAMTQNILLVEEDHNAATFNHEFHVIGSTGRKYTVRLVDGVASCSCPDHTFRQQRCKHIYFALKRILRATDSQAEKYRLERDEVDALFRDRPVHVMAPLADSRAEDRAQSVGRRPLGDNPCPICYDDFQADEPAIYCSVTCGHNMHRDCYDRWHKHSRGPHQCPMCRSLWPRGTAAV